jgi:hypothetical protein
METDSRAVVRLYNKRGQPSSGSKKGSPQEFVKHPLLLGFCDLGSSAGAWG